MGKYRKRFNNFKEKKEKVEGTVEEIEKSGKLNKKEKINERKFHHNEDSFDPLFDEDDFKEEKFDDGEVGIQPAQKPESFHHFVLENQYKDLERSIRGYKDIYDKESQKWILKRKKTHCFTDEEAEDILRTAQSHLATDIKLGWIRMGVFGDYMNALYKEIAFLFESIAEYRYGRYNTFDDKGNLVRVNYDTQYKMKAQNQKIFLELWTRIQANYSRSVNGQENKYTHESVKGQESLQSGDKDYSKHRGY